MQTYGGGVKIVADKLLASKGLAVEDYISYMSKENNGGDELSLYLLCRSIEHRSMYVSLGRIWCGTPVAVKIKIKTLLWLITKLF